jgi:hypothetical protein
MSNNYHKQLLETRVNFLRIPKKIPYVKKDGSEMVQFNHVNFSNLGLGLLVLSPAANRFAHVMLT